RGLLHDERTRHWAWPRICATCRRSPWWRGTAHHPRGAWNPRPDVPPGVTAATLRGPGAFLPQSPQVLVVDDDLAVGKVLVSLLEQADLAAEHVPSGERALERLSVQPFDLVLSDLAMAGMDGMALLRRVREQWPEIPFLILTAHGTVPLAVEAMRAG